MMKEFFIYEEEVPEGFGFDLFGVGHCLWIFCIIGFIVIFSLWYKEKNADTQQKIGKVISIYLLCSGIVRDLFLMLRGYYSVGFFPLHLCSMAILIAVIYQFTGNRYWGMVYILLCIPGAVSALLFPDWNAYPFLTYMNIHAFISHGLLVVFGMMQIVAKRLIPKITDIWMPVSFALAGCLFLYPFNKINGTNFWFINRPSEGSPLVFIYHLLGKNGYLAGYLLFCITVIVIWYFFIQILLSFFSKYSKI